MATRRESTDTETGEDIDESQFATGSAQTPAFSTTLSNNLHIFGQHGADMFSSFPSESDEQPLANQLWRQLQLNSPNPGIPSSTILQSTVYTDLYPYGPPSVSTIYTDLYGPQSVSTVLTDTDLDDTDVIESHNSFENIGNLSQDEEDMGLYPSGKKFRGNEKFLFCKLDV